MKTELTKVKHEIWKHIIRVRELLGEVTTVLIAKGMNHDSSKFESPEIEMFEKYVPRLKTLEYGSIEYSNCLKEMKLGLQHHYKHNSHHPEHYEHGINDMTLIDLIVMFVDWKATSEQHHGNLFNTINIGINRFNISPQLEQILKNTANWFVSLEKEQ